MSEKALGRLANVVPPMLVLIGLACFVFYLASGLARSGSLAELDAPFVVAFGMFLPLGAFIAMRRPSNPIGWLMTAIGFFVVVSSAATEYATRGLLVAPESLPGAAEMAYLASVIAIPGLALLSFLMLLFPTGKVPSPRWRWVARIAGANIAVIVVFQASLWPWRGPKLLKDEPPADSPIPMELAEVCWIIFVASAVAGLVSLIVRFRRSSGVERQQLKWMAYVAALVGALVVLNFFILDPVGVSDPVLRAVAENALNVAVAGIPVAAAIAISRYRLYDIDVLINRTLVYGTLSAILAAVYVGLVFGIQAVLAPVTQESDLAIAASTLAVAGLFRPVRSRLQAFIDRRFYRRKFDAQKTVEDFGTHLRDEVDLDSLTHRFVSAVQDTMQPAHVSLWLRKGLGS